MFRLQKISGDARLVYEVCQFNLRTDIAALESRITKPKVKPRNIIILIIVYSFINTGWASEHSTTTTTGHVSLSGLK